MPDPMETTSTAQPDSSQRARSLARIIDRLEPGVYTLTVTKPAEKTRPWYFELAQPVTIRKGALPKESTGENG